MNGSNELTKQIKCVKPYLLSFKTLLLLSQPCNFDGTKFYHGKSLSNDGRQKLK